MIQKVNRTHITIVNQGVDFIVDHLFETLTVDMIADHCCFSRYYYNRLFKSVTGESIYGFIKRLRLEAAAFKLIKCPHLSITYIAAELGYSSSNFSVLFKTHYGLSPSRFRSCPRLLLEPGSKLVLERIRNLQKNKPEALLNRMDRQVSFKEIPDITLMYQRFKGRYQDLPRVWQAFCEKMERLFPGFPVEYYGISYDDPLIAGENRCLYDLCAQVPRTVKVREENFRKIPAGSYLCYYFDGHVRELSRIYNDLFGVWMPHRGYITGPGLCFERYHPATEDGSRVVMDICVPVLSGIRAQIQK
jgi:AraC family transcriptional regulator